MGHLGQAKAAGPCLDLRGCRDPRFSEECAGRIGQCQFQAITPTGSCRVYCEPVTFADNLTLLPIRAVRRQGAERLQRLEDGISAAFSIDPTTG